MKEDEMQTRGIFEVVIFAQCLQISRPVLWRGPGKGLGTASVWSQVLSALPPPAYPRQGDSGRGSFGRQIHSSESGIRNVSHTAWHLGALRDSQVEVVTER